MAFDPLRSRRARRLALLLGALLGVWTVADAQAAPAGTAATGSAGPSASADEKPGKPRLIVAVGPIIGPHISGEEDCRPNGPSIYCENTGNLLGFGLNMELRGQLYGPLYAQLRGVLVGNVRGADGVYNGMAIPGAGLALHGRRVFLRAEYLATMAFGNNIYRSPFDTLSDSKVEVGYHAGMFSAGARFYARSRVAFELWGGLVVGPKVERTTDRVETTGTNTQISFMAGLNVSFDAIPGKPRPARPNPSTAPAATPTSYPAPTQPPAVQPAQPQPAQPQPAQPQPAAQPAQPATSVQPAPATQPATVQPPAQPQPAPAQPTPR